MEIVSIYLILPIHQQEWIHKSYISFMMDSSCTLFIFIFVMLHMLIYAMNNFVDITTDHKTSCVHIGIDKKINMSSRGFIDDMNV